MKELRKKEKNLTERIQFLFKNLIIEIVIIIYFYFYKIK